MKSGGKAALETFAEAVGRSSTTKDGFRLLQVMAVPWSWRTSRAGTKRYGWVVQLWDGRRLYLTYSVKDGAGERAEPTIRPMPAFEIKPELPASSTRWFEPKDLNAALRRRNR